MRLGATAGAALALTGVTESAEGQAVGAAQGDAFSFFDVVKSRRSVRKFKDTPIPEGDLTAILDAARLAPTSGNQQPWKFLVLKERAGIDVLRDACIEASLARRARQGTVTDEIAAQVRQYYTDYLSAPVYVVVLTDNESTYPTYNHWDGPLAAGYLMLAARALGYGTVHATDSIPDAVTKKVLGIPDRYTRVCITPIGVPEEWPESPPKKELEEFVVFESF